MKSSVFAAAILAAGMSVAACTPSDAKKSAQSDAPPPATQAETQTAPETTEAAEDEVPNYDEPLTEASLAGCVVVLNLTKLAIDAGTVQADKAVVQTALTKYQTQLEAGFNPDERAQLVGSTVAFFDQLPPVQLKASADVCLAAQDQTFDPANG